MRGVPLHVYYIHFSQYTHPMGSGRPPLAAGEFEYFLQLLVESKFSLLEYFWIIIAGMKTEFAFDAEFVYPMSRKLPGMLWCHVGRTLMMDGTKHPLLR